MRFDRGKRIACFLLFFRLDIRTEAKAFVAFAVFDDGFDSVKSAAANKENIFG